APPNLVTLHRDGRAIDAVAQITKSGHVFVFERETGKPLFPIKYRKYAKSDVEGEVTAESQPLRRSPNRSRASGSPRTCSPSGHRRHTARCSSGSGQCAAPASSSP